MIKDKYDIIFKKIQIISQEKIHGKIIGCVQFQNNSYYLSHKPSLRNNTASFYQEKITIQNPKKLPFTILLSHNKGSQLTQLGNIHVKMIKNEKIKQISFQQKLQNSKYEIILYFDLIQQTQNTEKNRIIHYNIQKRHQKNQVIKQIHNYNKSQNYLHIFDPLNKLQKIKKQSFIKPQNKTKGIQIRSFISDKNFNKQSKNLDKFYLKITKQHQKQQKQLIQIKKEDNKNYQQISNDTTKKKTIIIKNERKQYKNTNNQATYFSQSKKKMKRKNYQQEIQKLKDQLKVKQELLEDVMQKIKKNKRITNYIYKKEFSIIPILIFIGIIILNIYCRNKI